jgi:hypothetical protein
MWMVSTHCLRKKCHDNTWSGVFTCCCAVSNPKLCINDVGSIYLSRQESDSLSSMYSILLGSDRSKGKVQRVLIFWPIQTQKAVKCHFRDLRFTEFHRGSYPQTLPPPTSHLPPPTPKSLVPWSLVKQSWILTTAWSCTVIQGLQNIPSIQYKYSVW